MIYLKTYQKYIINNFLATLGKIFFIFLCLTFVLTIFEEISFFKDIEISFIVPFLLTLLNVPTVLYEIFPFIFLISTQFFFIKLADRHELIAFKNFGLDNTKVLKLISFTTLLMGILVVTIFYNISATMKFLYLDIKNEYTKDNKYLAAITENGLWIKDEIYENINIVNAEKIDKKFKGLKWITPNFSNNPELEIDLINEIKIHLKRDGRNKMVMTNYSFFSTILEQKIFSTTRWHIFDGTDYPQKNNRYLLSYKNLLINSLKNNDIDVIYTISPVKNSNIYDYISKRSGCDHLSSHNTQYSGLKFTHSITKTNFKKGN